MEVLKQLIDMIKTDRSEDQQIKEIIDILKLFLMNKNLTRDPDELITLLKKIGQNLRNECPTAFPIFNILTRMMTLIKRSKISPEKEKKKEKQNSDREIKNSKKEKRHTLVMDITKQNNLLDIVKDLKDLETSKDESCNFATYHINEGETILIYGSSEYLESFIKNTFEEIHFTLIIVLKNNQKKPAILDTLDNKDVLFISENSIFTIMSRINKVFMDCHVIMSDGAIINEAGSFNIAIVAKEFAVPLFVIAPRFKFTPFYAFAQDTFNEFKKPQEIFKEAEGLENLEVVVGKFNLVPSEYITIIITENGEYSTNYVYRVFSEYYSDIDYGYHFD